MEHDVEKGTVDFHAAVVVNESHFSELIQKKADARACCAHHLRQSLLTQLRDYVVLPSVFSVTRQEQQDSSQSLFAGIEKLVNEVRFVSDISGQQMHHELVRKHVLPMKYVPHRLVANLHESAVRQGGCGRHPQWLPRQTTFPEKIAGIQYRYRGLLALIRDYGEFDLSFLDVKHSVAGIPLSEDRVLLGERQNLPALADGCQEVVGVEFSGLATLPRRFHKTEK